MGATTKADWIDDLFVDSLASWRSYLQSQMDHVKMDDPLWEATWVAIETGDFADLYRVSQDIADHMDNPDPRKQFLERIKLM